MKFRHLLTAAVLVTAGLQAQIPFGHIGVSMRRASGTCATETESGFVVVDPVSLSTTTLENLDNHPAKSMIDVLSAVEDPIVPAKLYLNGAEMTCFIGAHIFPALLTGNRHPDIVKVNPAGAPGFTFPRRSRTFGSTNFLFTVAGGSNQDLWDADLTLPTFPVTRIMMGTPSSLGFADGLTIIGQRAYVVYHDGVDATTGALPSILKYVDLSDPNKPVTELMDFNPGSGVNDLPYADNITSIDRFAGTSLLLAGLDNGDVRLIDGNTGTMAPFISTGLGKITSIVGSANGVDNYISVDEGMDINGDNIYSVYTFPVLSQIFTVKNREIRDLLVGRHDQGSVAYFGDGCPGTNSTNPRMAFGGYPTQGNAAHIVKMEGGNPGQLVFVIAGLDRIDTDLGFLGAAGCNLYTNEVLKFTTTVQPDGTASIAAGIPIDPSIIDIPVITQCGIADPGANFAGLVTTNAAELISR